jgi:aminocarboxymuconate-semialdehyde decarboxylase
MIVDYHAHWNPPAYVEFLEGREKAPRVEPGPDGGWIYTIDDVPFANQWRWGASFQDLDESIADMDQAGVGVSVLSPALFGGEPTSRDLGFAREALGLLNEEMAAAQSTYPSRLRALAMLPLQDTDASIEMLDRCVGELGMAGVCITSNLEGTSIAPKRLMPLYERIEELGVPIVLHPSFRSTAFASSLLPSTEGGAGARLLDISLGWVYDSSLAVMSLICNGVFDECPGLSVLHPHAGGVIPYLKGRITAATAVSRKLNDFTLERSVDEYLATNVYVDFAAGSSPGMLDLAVETYGSDHLLFGSDFPFIPRGNYHELLDRLDSSLADEIRSNRLPGIPVEPS